MDWHEITGSQHLPRLDFNWDVLSLFLRLAKRLLPHLFYLTEALWMSSITDIWLRKSWLKKQLPFLSVEAGGGSCTTFTFSQASKRSRLRKLRNRPLAIPRWRGFSALNFQQRGTTDNRTSILILAKLNKWLCFLLTL